MVVIGHGHNGCCVAPVGTQAGGMSESRGMNTSNGMYRGKGMRCTALQEKAVCTCM